MSATVTGYAYYGGQFLITATGDGKEAGVCRKCCPKSPSEVALLRIKGERPGPCLAVLPTEEVIVLANEPLEVIVSDIGVGQSTIVLRPATADEMATFAAEQAAWMEIVKGEDEEEAYDRREEIGTGIFYILVLIVAVILVCLMM